MAEDLWIEITNFEQLENDDHVWLNIRTGERRHQRLKPGTEPYIRLRGEYR